MDNVVITIARQYGSGGKTIAAMLAKELGVNCYSREILKMAPRKAASMSGCSVKRTNGEDGQLVQGPEKTV